MLIANLLYILQAEDYHVRRFLVYAYTHWPWWRLQKRQKLVWTPKVIVLCVITWLLIALLTMVIWYFSGWWQLMVALIFIYILLPILIVASLVLAWPIDIILKLGIVNEGKKKLQQKKIIKIGITGSYGKTSMKEILASVLGQKYKVAITPENVNTDVGAARYITNKLDSEDVLIVEMGAYSKQDIVNLCDLVNPDYSILTGITSAHLDRFGSIEKIIEAKYELPRRTEKLSILNFNDENVKNNITMIKGKEYSGIDDSAVTEIKFLEDFEGINFCYKDEEYQTRLLARHNIVLILMAIELAFELGISQDDIKKGVSQLKPIEHRLQPIYHPEADMWVLDDSYNANINGVESGIEVLNRAKGRKIVLTPGPLVELGVESQKVHQGIGRLYAENVDLVLLIKSKETGYVIDGLNEKGFTNYRVFDTTKQAHEALPNIIKRGDTVLLQNDWPDVYF